MRTLRTCTLALATVATAMTAAGAAGAAPVSPLPVTAYVISTGTVQQADTVTPIDTAADKAEAAITVGKGPDAIAITPDGKLAFVVSGRYPCPTCVQTKPS